MREDKNYRRSIALHEDIYREQQAGTWHKKRLLLSLVIKGYQILRDREQLTQIALLPLPATYRYLLSTKDIIDRA